MPTATPRNLANSAGGIDVEAWTEQALSALHTAGPSKISTILPIQQVRGTSVTLEIPLDANSPRTRDASDARALKDEPVDEAIAIAYTRRREPLRRDSLRRREALLKGKEGSRRRQKWENDRLLGNPWAQPPLPHDWEVRPTHPVHSVPYFLAPLWDERQAERMRNDSAKSKKDASMRRDEAVKITKDLRQKLKRSKGAKGLLQDLEEEVRKFLVMWDERGQELVKQGLADVDSSEDEEIVFVGRNGAMKESQSAQQEEKELRRDKLIFDSLVDDHGASFGRWLVHSIAAYYNLRTWSVTTSGVPARREAYVGIREPWSNVGMQLPRPLWGIV